MGKIFRCVQNAAKSNYYENFLLVYDKSVRYLLRRGADRYVKNDQEKTALDIAKEDESGSNNRQRIINWLQMCYKV